MTYHSNDEFRPRLDSKYSFLSNEDINLILESKLRESGSNSGPKIKRKIIGSNVNIDLTSVVNALASIESDIETTNGILNDLYSTSDILEKLSKLDALDSFTFDGDNLQVKIPDGIDVQIDLGSLGGSALTAAGDLGGALGTGLGVFLGAASGSLLSSVTTAGFMIITDGTNEQVVNVSGESQVADDDTHTKLDIVNTALDSIDTSNDNIDTSLNNIETDIGNIDTSLNNIETDTGNIDTSLNNIEIDTGYQSKQLLNQQVHQFDSIGAISNQSLGSDSDVIDSSNAIWLQSFSVDLISSSGQINDITTESILVTLLNTTTGDIVFGKTYTNSNSVYVRSSSNRYLRVSEDLGNYLIPANNTLKIEIHNMSGANLTSTYAYVRYFDLT